MTVTEPGTFIPAEPETLEQTGLTESAIEHLVLKILYFRGDIFGQELSTAIGLRFSLIQDIVEQLKLRHLIQLKRSLGMGSVASVFALTETGRARAREYLDANQYAGAAPVPLAQYVEGVRQQKLRDGWLTKEALRQALKGMVLSEHVFSQVGPAVSSNNSLLIYGKPGDGKTFLVESLNNLDSAPIFLPHAIECQGNIVQLYDPIYHQRLEEDEEEPSALAVSHENAHDRRWVKCRRPFIVSGGELSLDMLDLRYNQNSKVYEAPFQLKANNGVYLIDDFGRQRATPAEVLNRWIVPMERRVDYLSFLTGGKMTAPFEAFLVFSTNLNPSDLGDEAFLRRIQYKMLLRGPTESEFIRIFEGFCSSRKLPFADGIVKRFIEKRYRTGKPFRRCHPRDVLSHALNLIHFEKLPYELTDTILDRAFESCFLQENEGEAHIERPVVAVVAPVASPAGVATAEVAGPDTAVSAVVAAAPLAAAIASPVVVAGPATAASAVISDPDAVSTAAAAVAAGGPVAAPVAKAITGPAPAPDPAPIAAAEPVAVTPRSCADYWAGKVAEIRTAFGTIMFAASFRDRANGIYRGPKSAQEFGETETSETLARLHAQVFRRWLGLDFEQKSRDLAHYAASTEGGAARLAFERLELEKMLTPDDANPLEAQVFHDQLSVVFESLCPRSEDAQESDEMEKIEQIA